MYAPELEIPIPFQADNLLQRSASVRRLAHYLPVQIHEAAILLDLFDRSWLESAATMPDDWFQDEPEIEAIVRQVVLPNDRPASYYQAGPQLHARTFVLTLRMIGTLMETIVNEAGAEYETLARISGEYDTAFPRLRDLRNSIAHAEDRLRGLAHKKPIQPLEVPGITIGGGVFFNGMLRNRSFGWTLADGTYGECEVSEASLRTAVAHVTAFISELVRPRSDSPPEA
jgi:hypothetical protein